MPRKIFGILCLAICLICLILFTLEKVDEEEGKTFYKNVFPSNNIDVNYLKKEFKEAVGYIEISDTNIAFPIMQGNDNKYYLKHLPNGNYNKMGSLFLDFRNNLFNDKNTIIYGHNFNNGTMFSDLIKFKSLDFFLEHENYDIYTESGNLSIFIIGVYRVLATDAEILIDFETFNEFTLNMEKIFERHFEYSDSDRFITLCTCDDVSSNFRILILGKVIN